MDSYRYKVTRRAKRHVSRDRASVGNSGGTRRRRHFHMARVFRACAVWLWPCGGEGDKRESLSLAHPPALAVRFIANEVVGCTSCDTLLLLPNASCSLANTLSQQHTPRSLGFVSNSTPSSVLRSSRLPHPSSARNLTTKSEQWSASPPLPLARSRSALRRRLSSTNQRCVEIEKDAGAASPSWRAVAGCRMSHERGHLTDTTLLPRLLRTRTTFITQSTRTRPPRSRSEACARRRRA